VVVGWYAPDGALTVTASSEVLSFPLGSRWSAEPHSLAASVFETGRAARVDDYSAAPGAFADAVRSAAVTSTVGVPILVGGVVSGVIVVGSSGDDRLPADTEQRVEAYAGLVAAAISSAESSERLAWLIGEHAAVRRVTALVTEGAAADELFAAAAAEAAHLVGVSRGVLFRHEPDGSLSAVGSADDRGELGLRPLAELAATVCETRRPVRQDVLSEAAIGVPVPGDVSVWGVLCVGAADGETLAADVDERLRSFAEPVAIAISTVESRARLRRLADGQVALRRVATLVAGGASAAELYAAVSQEVVRVLGVPTITLERFEPDGTASVLASLNAAAFHVGSRWPLDGPSLSATILDTGRAARIDDYSKLTGTIAAAVRGSNIRSAAGAPIIVDGVVWGLIWVATSGRDPLPDGIETRLRDFTELVGIAVSNADSRQHLRRLADQQASLRRVATLAAEGATLHELFSRVATELAGVLDVSAVSVVRYESDGTSVVVASFNDPSFRVGSRWPYDGSSLNAKVYETDAPVWIDDYADVPGAVAEAARASGIQSGVGVPIVVDGATWGMIAVGRRLRRETLPVFTGNYTGRIVLVTETMQEIAGRLAAFTDLIATAISRTQAHDDLRLLAEEQAALRRVATRVAKAAPAEEIFAAVVAEVARVLGLEGIEMARYQSDGTAVVIGASGEHPFPTGSRWTLDDPSIMARVFHTNRPARIDAYSDLPGAVAAAARSAGFRSAIGAPIIVDGATWGALVAFSALEEPIAEGSEIRLSEFTDLVATAVSNATARDDLNASRARIVAAGDEARRRIERDLHDGAQQRLLALGLDLQRVRATIPASLAAAHEGLGQIEADLMAVLEEVRELSRGLHPAQLSRGGLGPSLRALARRSPIPVETEIVVAERPPAPLETAVYYVVSEALTNAIKHSRASTVSVTVVSSDGVLQATVADDGIGGAEAGGGTGLTGLVDRVEALGGRLVLQSLPERGTTIVIQLPIAASSVL
jgi:signal transduction histidine kinase